jgi:hypothetical protein
MKRVFLFGILILLILPLITSENVTMDNSDNEQAKISEAYSCLRDKIGDDCSSSIQDNIFSLLAVGKCKDEVIDDSSGEECWPKNNCDVKTTAQAVLALDDAGTSTSKAEKWLLSKNNTSPDLTWYLEIESPKATICEITYSGASYTVSIDEEKRISTSAGSCLTLSEGGWWLRVSQSCYGNEFEISCNEQFLTTLLFSKEGSSTIHISEKTSSASAEGTTKEKINSYCFMDDGSCDYEGTLWAAFVLGSLDYKISYYVPYLISMKEQNEEYLPESFLYFMTGYTDFRNELLLKQKTDYWDESGDKFYDTALALYPFQYEEVQEKSKSKEWLLEIQQDDGCWDGGNIRNNAFLLYSLWPDLSGKGTAGGGGDDCEDSGYYCMSEINCIGNILKQYDCAGTFKCCDTPKSSNTCVEQGGEVCTSGQTCSGDTIDADDLSLGEVCCTGGICEAQEQKTECEIYGGECGYSCGDNQEESSYECNGNYICCIEKTGGESWLKSLFSGGAWLIWLLAVLIILAVFGIIFRNKLKSYFYKIKSKFGRGKPGSGGTYPRFPPSATPVNRPLPRRILPPSYQSKKPYPRKKSEIDDVLKKLKDMGK